MANRLTIVGVLDCYTAPNENSVPVAAIGAERHSGPRRAERAKKHCQPAKGSAFHGISRPGLWLVGVVALSAPLFAHHGAASFDSGKLVTVKGTVTEYVWSNPHVLVKVDAKDDSGNVAHWVLEAWNPVTQASRGWSKNTFKPGDEVSLDIARAKNNQPVGEIRGRIVINGKEFKESQ